MSSEVAAVLLLPPTTTGCCCCCCWRRRMSMPAIQTFWRPFINLKWQSLFPDSDEMDSLWQIQEQAFKKGSSKASRAQKFNCSHIHKWNYCHTRGYSHLQSTLVIYYNPFQSATTVVSKWGGSNIGCWFNHANHYHFENKGHCKSNISCQLCYDKGTAFLSILSAEWVECSKQAANWIDRNALRCNFSTSLLWLAKNAKKAEALFVPIHWNAFSSRLFWLD